MPFHLDWTSPSLIRKRFLHSRGNLIRYSNILYASSMNNVFKLLISSKVRHSVIISMDFISNPYLSTSGFSLWLQVICLTFWRYWPQHVPCWQRGVQLICTRSGFHYQRNLPVPGRARNLPLLSHWYIFSSVWILCTFYCLIYWLIPHLFIVLHWNTEYCGTFCYPNVAQSPYLHTVGEKLLPDIEVLWTGESNSFLLTDTITAVNHTVTHV